MAENSPYRTTSNNIFAHSGAPTEIVKLVDTIKANHPDLLNRSVRKEAIVNYPDLQSLISKILEYGKQSQLNVYKDIKEPDFNAYAKAFSEEYTSGKYNNIGINKSGLPYIALTQSLNTTSSETYASKITTGFHPVFSMLGAGFAYKNRDTKIKYYLSQISRNSDPANDAKNLNEALSLYFNKAKGLYATNDEVETDVEAEFKKIVNDIFIPKYNEQAESKALTEKFFEAAKKYNLISDWLGITN